MPVKHAVEEVLAEAGKFVVSRGGVWNHDEWECFVAGIGAMGIDLDDECRRNLGNVLEVAKYFYFTLPAVCSAKTAAKPKAKSKAKPRA